MTVAAAAKDPRLGYTLLLYFPPSVTWQNLVTSYNDIMIVWSIILEGKTTVHAQKNHHSLSAHLPVSMPNIPKIMEIQNLVLSF